MVSVYATMMMEMMTLEKVEGLVKRMRVAVRQRKSMRICIFLRNLWLLGLMVSW